MLIRILLFFPSLTFQLLPAEIFPWSWFYQLKNQAYNRPEWLLTVISLLLITLATALLFSVQWLTFFQQLSIFAAYINSFGILLIYRRINLVERQKLENLISKILVFFLIFGLIQAMIPLSAYDNIIRILVPRASFDILTHIGGRGVTLFASEPARASYELIFMYAAWRYLNRNIKAIIYFDLIFILYGIFLLKSGTFIVYALILFSLYIILARKFYLSLGIIFGFIFIVFVGSRPDLINVEANRGITFFETIINSPNDELLEFLLQNTGSRGPSMYAIWTRLPDHPFGYGFGLYEPNLKQLYVSITEFNYYDLNYFNWATDEQITSVRPNSIATQIIFDFGLIGLPLIFFLWWKLWKNCTREKLPIYFLFVSYILLQGSLGDPIPMLMTAVVIYHKNHV